MTKKLLMGNEAMAHAALEAGVGVVAGYPGTPSSEIVETVARLRASGAAHGVHVEWSTNEKAALELLFGASLAGMRGLFTCKQMGLNVASDALMSLNYVSVRAGLVLIVADDPGPISSQTEQDTRRFAAFAKVPVLDPATPEQAFDMVKAAFELSERFHTPVIVRPTTRVDHASTFIDVEDETHALPLMNAVGERPQPQPEPEAEPEPEPEAEPEVAAEPQPEWGIAAEFEDDFPGQAEPDAEDGAQEVAEAEGEPAAEGEQAPEDPDGEGGEELAEGAQGAEEPETGETDAEEAGAGDAEGPEEAAGDTLAEPAEGAQPQDSETGEAEEAGEAEGGDAEATADAAPTQAARMSEAVRADWADQPTQAIRLPEGELVPEADPAQEPGGFVRDPDRWVIFPRRAYQAHGEINDRLRQMAEAFSVEEDLARFNVVKEAREPGDDPEVPETASGHVRHARVSNGALGPTYGIMAGGVSAAYVQEALRMIDENVREAGLRAPAYRFMQVGTPYPFPEAAVARFCSGLSDVLVIEELDYVLEDQLAQFVGRTRAGFNIHGKLTGEARDRGENDVDDVMARIERFLGLTGRLSMHRARAGAHAAQGAHAASPSDPVDFEDDEMEDAEALRVRLPREEVESLPVRPPVLCAGCPHRGSFHAVKVALGKTPAVMCGDIGCYTLGNAAPLDAVDTCLCMGAGITMAQGIAVADPGKKAIAYVGDSTFFASGMTGLANAAYNGHDITVMVLDNATTAMTGAQPHPGTGDTLMGTRSMPLDIEVVLQANGFERIFYANPFDAEESVVAVKAALAFEGPSAVLFQGACAQLVPPDAPVSVNPDVCTGCKRCITSIGCPALSFNPAAAGERSGGRGQAVVDADLCVGCGLCTYTCPFKAIERGSDD